MTSSSESTQDAPQEPQERRSRSQVWILLGVFFAPLVIAFLLYYGLDGWRPGGSTNHGELVQPPTPLPELSLATPDGNSLAPTALRGKWTLVYIGGGECDSRCREALTLMRQTRFALNDDLTRVQRVFLATERCCDGPYLSEHHAGLLIARLDDGNGAQMKAAFQRATATPVEQAGRIYIVDPLGNLMMSYAPDAEPKGLLIDLKKLLKLSHIG
jgi:hypothetical protein